MQRLGENSIVGLSSIKRKICIAGIQEDMRRKKQLLFYIIKYYTSVKKKGELVLVFKVTSVKFSTKTGHIQPSFWSLAWKKLLVST